MFVSPPKFTFETLIPHVMVLEDGVSGGSLGHEGGVLRMGLVPLEETGKTLQLSLFLFGQSALSLCWHTWVL